MGEGYGLWNILATKIQRQKRSTVTVDSIRQPTRRGNIHPAHPMLREYFTVKH